MFASIQGILDWFTGGSVRYMTLYHCMRMDTLWVAITVALDVSVATGYILIAMHWWKNQKRVPATPAREALSNIRNIFIFCGLCGYAFIPVKMFWPAWRLYDMFMAVLVYFTWKYALRAKDLKVVYNELGRSNELSRELELSRDESRRKTFFLNSLSHDLRTPLNALALHSQVASVSLSSGDTQALRNSLLEIETNARATAELLDSLLQCARLDWSEPPNAMTEFELAPFLGALIRANATAAEGKRLALDCECPPGAVIETDRMKLERVLTNLLTNAIKFTPSGSVRLVAECASGAMEIHVIDTGMGLSPEQQARLFEEFYQVQNYERDRKKGFGLGLSIARRLARQLGGDIEVDSAIGRGSRFSILLPGVVRPSRASDRTAPAANAVGAG
jgi:signal transduction histidine kinase